MSSPTRDLHLPDIVLDYSWYWQNCWNREVGKEEFGVRPIMYANAKFYEYLVQGLAGTLTEPDSKHFRRYMLQLAKDVIAEAERGDTL